MRFADELIRREAAGGESLPRIFDGLMGAGHRAMGSPGEKAAREHALGLFRSFGLDASLQEFDVRAYERGRARALVRSGEDSAELPCLAFMYCPPTGSPLDLELVGAGSGDPGDIAALGDSLRGKAAYARPSDIMRSARNRDLTRAGAAACVFGSHADSHDACIISYVREEIVDPVPVVGLNRTGSDLLESFLASGPVRLELETRGGSNASRSANVTAVLPGTTALPEIVVGGHLDSYDLCEGALDNGAGAALILETARILAMQPRPRRTVRFVLFTGEEVNSTGARRWAAEFLRDPSRTGLYFNVDMPAEGGVPGVLAGEGMADAALWDGLKRDIGADFPVQPLGARFSDHETFAEKGVPCLWLRAARIGSRGIARIEHTVLDTPDKVDLAELREATVLAARLISRFAEADVLHSAQTRSKPPTLRRAV